MNYPHILMKSLPTKTKPIDHNFIFKRFYELLDICALQKQFYDNIYLCFFSQTGFPFENIYQKSDDKKYSDLVYGDVIVIDEIVNYSRLYQHVSKDISLFECIFIEQYLERNPDPNVIDVWKNKIPNFIEYKIMEKSEMPIYSLRELKKKEELLTNDFMHFIIKNKSKYIMYLFQELKNKYPDKHDTIVTNCDNIEKLHELLFEEFLDTHLKVSKV